MLRLHLIHKEDTTSLHFNYMHGTNQEKEVSYLGLIILMLGELTGSAYKIMISPALKKLLSDFKTRLPSVFRKPVLLLLRETTSNTMIPVVNKWWTPDKRIRQSKLTADIPVGGSLLEQFYAQLKASAAEDVRSFQTQSLRLSTNMRFIDVCIHIV